MLYSIPDGAYGRLGALLSALIVAAGVIGLTMHKDFYAGIRRKGFYCFYTNLSNLLVVVYFSLIAPMLYKNTRLQALIPHAEFLIMMSIMLTFSVFHIMIFPAVSAAAGRAARTREFYIVLFGNGIVHYLVPWLVFAYWLLCSPGKRALGTADVFLWTAIPAGYLAVILLRAAILRENGVIADAGSPYPYPFLDVKALGGRRVARVCFILYAFCLAAGAVMVLCVRGLITLFGDGYALFLV